MDFKPNFVFMPPGMKYLRLQCTAEATKLAKAYRSKPAASTCKSASLVKEEAVARVVQGGGDPECWQLVLSETTLQFGQYRGQTFKWLLANDVGYCAMVVASHQKERDNGDTSQSPLAANKDALATYARVFPEMAAVVRHRLMVMGAPLVRELDQQLLKMGQFPGESYSSLYESTDERHRAYVRHIRTVTATPGSFLHNLNAYIVGRDNEANYKVSRPATSERPSALSEPSDDVLLAAAMEVESQSSQPSTSSASGAAAHALWASGDTLPQLLAPKQQGVLPKGWAATLPESEHAKFSAWEESIRKQLHISKQLLFPAVLTYKLACDKAVISLLRTRSLGNSATLLRQALTEIHGEEWLARSASYLSILNQLGVPASGRDDVPPMRPLPRVPWFVAAYVRDVLPRLEDNKGRLTSVFGNILKMDSTKKLTKKLAGESAGMAAWVTNVGNENGQVLMSVLTAAEGEGRSAMVDGLVRRYKDAGKPPPEVLYINRDCCSVTGKSKIHSTFGLWDRLVVRLDVWHLMRRFARGVITDAHL
ncbi:uncharacterized protein LOC109528225, partial [Hippocampus comes]|uniref:uncharacterized protein LOC109528225 n=1 Tax=Hippocampus comes TaxID=109280 RepID=UPI00094E90B3